VSRYDWPAGGRGDRIPRGQSEARRRYNIGLNAGFDPGELADARALRHTAESDPAAADAAVAANLSAMAVGSPHVGGRVELAAPPGDGPNADRDLWLPLGPAGTLRGQADSDPRVAGRVRDLKVSRNGQRAYAVSAMGGLWYTNTAGAHWEPVGAWAMVTNPADLAAASHTLSGGAVHVRFDPGNDPEEDEVWVGTGEPSRSGQVPFETGFGAGQFGGVGILHAKGPVARNPAEALVDPWTREAQPRPAAGPTPAYPGLRSQAVYTIVADPAAGPAAERHLVAATSRGLHERSGAAADPWSLVRVQAWDNLQPGISATINVHDAVWQPATAAHPARLWVTVVDAVAGLTGLWVSNAGPGGIGPFTPVALPGIGAPVNRLGLAADPTAPDVLYVLGSGPRLWRVDDLTPAVVTPLPNRLFLGSDNADRSGYNLAIAVDPGNINRVIVGGGAAQSPHDRSHAAAMYRLTLGALGAPGGVATYPTDYATGEAADDTWIGAEVHADVHRVRWSLVAGASHVWVCCDGGIFRSTAAGDEGTFASRSTGLAVTEAGWIALHPLSDGVVLTGVQDNGVQLRIGEGVWRRALDFGDCGGVAFDPGTPGRFVAQANLSFWDDDGNGGISPTIRRPPNTVADAAAFGTEHTASRFYSNAAVVRRGDGVTQLAVGTTRVWYSEQWGRSFLDGNVIRRHWDTLPSAGPAAPTDPRAGDTNDALTNDFGALAGPPPGGIDWGTGIHILRWAGPDRLYVLQRGAVHRLDRNPPVTGQWTRTTILTRAAPPAVAAAPVWPVAAAVLPPIGALNDLAVHVAAAGPHGSLYVATSHPLEPLWWFDGTATWHPSRLGTQPTAPPAGGPIPIRERGIRAPAYSVVLDPDDPATVYVGTAVGVWRGVLTLPGPTWEWTPFNSGLPEAAVQDLAVGTWPTDIGPLKLVRAALQARGIWEVEPDQDVAPATFLRVHPYDSRRVTPTPTADPMWHRPKFEREWPLDWADRRNRDHRTGAGEPRAAPDGTQAGQYHWHASPDIRLRPAPRAAGDPAVPAPPDLPWTELPRDRFALWSLQTALRTIDPLVTPEGRWTFWFRERLRAIRVRLGIDAGPRGQARVSAALWNHAQVQAGFWAEPWAEGGPTELDLVERIVGMATPRTGGPAARASSPAGAAVLRRRYLVDVCLHHRGRTPVGAAEMAVVLLRRQLPANATTWAGLGPITLPVGAGLLLLGADLDDLPPGGGALPDRLVLPAGWAVADPGTAVRRPSRTTATGSPQVVTFEVDFSAAPARSRWLLVALAHSTADPLRLGGADLRSMVLGSRHAGARSVEVV
jgi:hypothetical protein